MVGLYNKPGRGSKRTFTYEQEEIIIEWVNQEPRQLKKVLQKVKEEWGIEVSTKTIKRIIKDFYMSCLEKFAQRGEPAHATFRWHRMRRDVGGEPDPLGYKEKKAQLEELKQLDSEGKIDLYYLDETGFCLIPSVPYGWQNIGEYLPILSNRSRRLNVLGIMNRKNHLETYVSLQSINSDVVTYCIDTFFATETI
ncbi:hypothetical protein CAL7716_100220 (plasmid) [Calothrix sp. PCC 7716]|nr:hypothetical protein CAL7716_100220 [Calothrix sp. PCC 7716]